MTPNVPPSFYLELRYANPRGLNTWLEHVPFAYDLVRVLRPELLVELGTYYGESYFAFCQAVEEGGMESRCYAVDTWKGDEHAGFYDESVFEYVAAHNREYYQRFSSLLRTRFEDAARQFEDESISILHIDGLHTYDAVSHDFRLWFPKVRPGGVILLHDIAEKTRDFGAWRLWEELQPCFPSFAFRHGHGLGLIRKPDAPGEDLVHELIRADAERQEQVRRYYAHRGAQLSKEARASHARIQLFDPSVEGYSEHRSQTVYVDLSKWQIVHFRVPVRVQGRMRLDPGDAPGIIEISELVIEAPDAAVPLWSLHGASVDQVCLGGTAIRVSSDGILTVFSSGLDPQVLLPEIFSAAGEVTVRVTLRVRSGVRALAEFMTSRLQSPAGEDFPEW